MYYYGKKNVVYIVILESNSSTVHSWLVMGTNLKIITQIIQEIPDIMGCFVLFFFSPADLNALLLLSGHLFCSSLLNGALFREEGEEKSLSLSNSLALAALERSKSKPVELAILYQIEWKHVEWEDNISSKGAQHGFPTAHAQIVRGLRRGL